MINNLERFKEEIKELINEGNRLYNGFILNSDKINASQMKKLKKLDLPDFQSNYEQWYTKAFSVIRQILPDRLDDFSKLYKNEKRKEINHLTYTISDALIGLIIKTGYETTCGESAAIPKFYQQINILKSAQHRFESKLFDIKQVVQADLFDSELDAGMELSNNGFYRGAGVIAGVVLEKHLLEVCQNHNVSIRKKNSTISDLNDLLKRENIIEIPIWRFIQRLGDLRNLCGHNKDRDPNKEDVQELIKGVEKIIKTLF